MIFEGAGAKILVGRGSPWVKWENRGAERTCTFICMCVCKYVCMCVYAFMYVCVYVLCIYACMYACR